MRSILSPFHLSEKEFSTFLNIHQYGPLGTSSISRLSWLPRTTVYHDVEKLIDKHLVTVVYTTWPQKQYNTVSHTDIINVINEKRIDLEDRAKLLKSHCQQFAELRVNTCKPVVTFHTWEQIEASVRDKIVESDYADALWDIRLWLSHYGYSDDNVLAVPRIAKKLTRRILVDCELARKHAEIHQNDSYYVKFVDPDKSQYNDYILCDGCTMHVSYTNPGDPVGMIIRDTHFFEFQKKMFDSLRNQL